MVENDYEKIIILEDDGKFSLGFKSTLSYLIDEMKLKKVDWELL
jgi:hypothetical protein